MFAVRSALVIHLILAAIIGCCPVIAEETRVNDVSSMVFHINTDKPLSSRPISPLIYGNFLELGFAHQGDGMWSQMLFNRSFENIMPPTTVAKGEMGQYQDSRAVWWHSGYEEQPWYTYDDTGKTEISTDRDTPYSGFFHGRIAAEASHDGRGVWGIGQDELWLRAGVGYRFRGFVMCDHTNRTITVKLVAQDDPSHVIDSGQCIIGRAFTECALTLKNPDYTGRASFMVEATWPGKMRADGFDLYPTDAVKGWRRDIVDGLKRVRPTMIRFPGGCFTSFYNWRDGIGPRDDRMPVRSEFWGGIEYNDVGTDEFLDLCAEIHCEPFLVANVITGTPELAAEWVEYCNGPADSAMGKRRAANGHPQPRKVTYWELDNEPGRKFSAEQYAHRVVAYSKAMKAVDPTIKLAIEAYDYSEDMSSVLDICGQYIDFVSDRYYSEDNFEYDIAYLSAYEQKTGRRIGLCNTEWVAPTNPPASEAQREWMHDGSRRMQRWFYVLNAAIVLQRYQRNAEWFDFANFNNLVNTWGQNVIESSKSAAWLSCAGKLFEFSVDSPARWPVQAQPLKQGSVNVGAALADSKDKLIVSIVNTGEATEAQLEIGSNWKVDSARGLAAPELQSRNTEDEQNTVQAVEPQIRQSGEYMIVALPAYSVCEVTLKQ